MKPSGLVGQPHRLAPVRVINAPRDLDRTEPAVNQSSIIQLAAGPITNHDEITVILIEPGDGTATRTRELAVTPYDSRRHPLPCCGGGDRTHYR
jgi:hypothetical protein